MSTETAAASTAADPGARQRLLRAAREELDAHGASAMSLRAVARRAGVSHALPKYYFGDRAGLLTAIATDGFHALAERLRHTRPASLARLGEAYLRFGLEHPALSELMFRPAELRANDPKLRAAQATALGALSSTLGGADTDTAGPPSHAVLTAWAFAHGLLVLSRDGALTAASPAEQAELATTLLRDFEREIAAPS